MWILVPQITVKTHSEQAMSDDTAYITMIPVLDRFETLAHQLEHTLISQLKHENMNHSVDTSALVKRLFQLPHDLYIRIWELILNNPRVINLEFQCGSDRRCSWQFSRDHIERLTYPARLLDSRSFETIGDFNRSIRVMVNLGRPVDFKLSLERDIFYLQSFHSSMMISATDPVGTKDASVSETKCLHHVMVSSDDIFGHPVLIWKSGVELVRRAFLRPDRPCGLTGRRVYCSPRPESAKYIHQF